MWPGQWIRHQVNVLLDQFPSWTWKGTVRRDRLLSRKKNLNNIYIRSMFASTMRVLAPRRHSGMAPWSLGELCWMSMYSVGNIIIWCNVELTLNITSALCLCTQLSVDSMVSNKIDDGQIIMIGSMSGHRVPPNPSTRQIIDTLKLSHLHDRQVLRCLQVCCDWTFRGVATGAKRHWRQHSSVRNLPRCAVPHNSNFTWHRQSSHSRIGPNWVPGRHVPGQPRQGGRHPQQRALPPVWGQEDDAWRCR